MKLNLWKKKKLDHMANIKPDSMNHIEHIGNKNDNNNAADISEIIDKISSADAEKICKMLEQGRKIEAIQDIMQATGISLVAAKNIADNYGDIIREKVNA